MGSSSRVIAEKMITMPRIVPPRRLNRSWPTARNVVRMLSVSRLITFVTGTLSKGFCQYTVFVQVPITTGLRSGVPACDNQDRRSLAPEQYSQHVERGNGGEQQHVVQRMAPTSEPAALLAVLEPVMQRP